MKWSKKRYKMEEDDSSQTSTVVINAEQLQTSSSIRVVENKIFFYDDITRESILELNKLLLEIDTKLQNTKNVLGDDYSPVIHLHMNTYGGEIHAALSTLDLMPTLSSKVYTYVEGCVASAGTLISIAGDKRFMGKHASLLIHQLSGEMYGKYSEMMDDMENCSNLMKCLKGIYKEYTKIPMKTLDDLLKRDIYLDSKECLSYGIIDEIL